MRKKLFALAIFALLVILPIMAFGQGTVTGAVSGIVTNPNKEVIPGAAVVITNTATNKVQTSTTDGSGHFKVGSLEPGTYTVTVNSSGFAPSTQQVVVEVGLETKLDIAESVAGVTGSVEIMAESPVVNTSQQDYSSNMNQTSISQLPINGQRWSNFALLTPGTTPDGNFGLISFRGISGLLNNNTIDGGDNNQAFFSEERGRTRINYVVSQRAIKEFQVNTSNYSAEYGRAAGGVTNAVTKSGTNQFHGDAFLFDRDNRFGARNPLGFITSFNSATGAISRDGFKPVDKRYTFGADIGGPIVKDKAFFFFNYDEVRRNFPGLAIFSSPSYLTTVNTATTGAGLKAPTRALTDAQINSVLSFLNSETGPVPRNGNQRIFMPKVDINLNQSNTLSVTYNRFKWASLSGIQTQPTNTIGRKAFGDDFVNDDSVNVRLTSNFGPTSVNEFRFQWSRDFEFEFSQTPLAGEPLTAPAYPGLTQAGTRSPDTFTTNGIEWGVATFLERPQFPNEKRKQFFDAFTLARGNHTFKFGGDFNRVNNTADNLRFYAGAYSYSNINDFIVDYLNWQTPGGIKVGTTPVVCSSSTRSAGKCYTSNYQQAFGATAFKLNTNFYNVFAQDDWRYTPRLTLNLGIRWEYQTFPRPFLANPAIPQTSVMPNDKNNFGPRVGFAWDISGNGKNSLRGGYGIYYGAVGTSTTYNALVNTAMPGGQFQVSLSQTAAAAPTYPNTLATQPANPTVGVQFYQKNFQLPRIQQGDLVFEHEIAPNTVVSASLLLSFGSHLPTFVDTNMSFPKQSFAYSVVGGPFGGQTLTVPWFYGTSRPNPNFGAMTEIRSAVWSQYVAGVVQFNRRMSKGLQFQANYTRSSARDLGQTSTTFTATNSPFNAFNLSGEAGASNFDFPNKVSANAVWQPEWKNALARGWTLSPILSIYSGAPLTGVVSGSIPSPGLSQDATCWPGTVTTNACSTPGGGVNGSGGATRFTLSARNSFRLPHIMNVDMRVARKFHLGEKKTIEIMLEGFNLFNRTQVTGQNNTFYAGTATAATCNATHTSCTPASAVLNLSTAFQTTNAAGGTLFRERQMQGAIRFQF